MDSEMLNSPLQLQFRPNLQLLPLGDGGYCVVSEYDTFLLHGTPLDAVIPLIDGTRSYSQIVHAASPLIGVREAEAAISTLATTGYLEVRDPFAPAGVASFCAELATTVAEARARLRESQVRLLNFSSANSDELFDLLKHSGIVVGDTGAALTLILCDDYRDPRLRDWNDVSLRTSQSWLLAKPGGHNYWIGPHFIPSAGGPCWECLDHRLSLNRAAVRLGEVRSGNRGVLRLNTNPIASSATQGYGAVVNQVLRILINRPNPLLATQLYVSDTLNLGASWHFVVKRPECPACGSAAIKVPHSWQDVQASSSASSEFGGVRSSSAEATYRRFLHHVSPLTGIVRALEPSPYNDSTPLRVYSAGHNFALGGDTPAVLTDSLRMFSSGKGRTDIEARTSALCEALERYSGLFQGTEERLVASFKDLGQSAIDPTTCMLFSDQQYSDRKDWNERGSRFQVIPSRFDPSASIDWSPVRVFGEDAIRYLPTSYLYYGYPYQEETFFCWADSNGCAAGATYDDACLQGLLELVERDAIAIWWYNRLHVAGVDLDALGDSYYHGLNAYYRKIGREFWVLNLTHDLGVPVFCAINRRIAGPTEDIVLGFGAHLDPKIALSRAVTEMNQFMPAVLNVNDTGQTVYSFFDRDALHWWTSATLENQPYIAAKRLDPLVDCYGNTASSHGGSALMLRQLVERLRSRGLQVLVLDQTRAEVGLPVVKMIVPGLRHFWARFAPGRLFDVPVEQGSIESQTPESELNPIPMFV